MMLSRRISAPYFTELQLQDWIWERRDRFLRENPCQKLLREQEIGFGLRPDFLNIEAFHHPHEGESFCTRVFEIKRFADLSSIAQVANYLHVIRDHSRFTPPTNHFASLFALGFDSQVHSAAEELGIDLFRIRTHENRLEAIECERHPFAFRERDSRFQIWLDGFRVKNG